MAEETQVTAGPRGYADVHIHLLPGVDDGPADFDESLALLEAAWAAGTRHFCATAHVGPRGNGWTPDQGAELLEELGRRAASRGLDPDLRLGAEIALYAEILKDGAEGKLTTLGGGRYVLIESPDTSFPPNFSDFVFRFRGTGLVPVLAHPERTDEMQRDPSRLKAFVAAGAMAQVTAGSLLGDLGRKVRKTVAAFLKDGAVHAISSDGHACLGRSPDLGAAEKEAASILRDAPLARHLVTAGPLRLMTRRP